MASSGSEQIHMRKVKATVPQGVHVPMYFCGDLCKLVQSKILGDYYGIRFFMCDNYAQDLPKGFGNVRPKLVDTKQSDEDKTHVQQQAHWARERWQRMMYEKENKKKRKKDQEEICKRIKEVDCQDAEVREAERERKQERARRSKEAGPDVISKGKYTRCTQ